MYAFYACSQSISNEFDSNYHFIDVYTHQNYKMNAYKHHKIEHLFAKFSASQPIVSERLQVSVEGVDVR